jgi:hypothetical protein
VAINVITPAQDKFLFRPMIDLSHYLPFVGVFRRVSVDEWHLSPGGFSRQKAHIERELLSTFK